MFEVDPFKRDAYIISELSSEIFDVETFISETFMVSEFNMEIFALDALRRVVFVL